MRDESIKSVFEDHGGNIRRRTCMLMVTHKCNLNCSYCYETHKDDQEMSFEMAKRILREEFDFVQKSDAFEELEIDFMGGEPLMNFPLIKQIVEWLESDPPPVPYICFATTNGTLLDSNMREWLEKHKDTLWLSISYDGNEHMQNTNRNNTGNLIDIEFFHRLWPKQAFQMTVSKETLSTLSQGVIHIKRKGYDVNASLAQGANWDREDAVRLYKQLTILSNYFYADPNLGSFNLLNRKLYNVGRNNNENPQTKWCGSGTHMVIYDVDGRKYACQLFTPIVLGARARLSDSMQEIYSDKIEDPMCQFCVLKNFCSTCIGYNYRDRFSIEERDKRSCRMQLAIAQASCQYQIKLLQSRVSLTRKEAEYAKEALMAYSSLSQFQLTVAEPPFQIDSSQ